MTGAKSTSKSLRRPALDYYIEDLFRIECVLAPRDTLIIVIDDEPNDTLKKHLEYIFEKDGIFVVLHNIKRLQFNITNHVLVPHHRILDDTERAKFLVDYHIRDAKQQLPEISRFDPVALAINLRPSQICCISRKSITALHHDYYRICV